ncbi:EAL domain-containing protein [Halomonas alkalicola]|uniref:EAL domain-containing protein n=1 Tax=Halomonas alkalicola TaxID=1930622 RepID=UPI00265D9CA5|nr:EAL domain-containing protein [Halomonas alkalicola]
MPTAFLLGLLMIALGAMAWALAERRTASMEEARRYTIAKAELVSDWVSGSFTLSEHLLAGTGQLALESLADSDAPAMSRLSSRLDRRVDAVAFVDAVALLTPTGEPLASSDGARMRAVLDDNAHIVDAFLASPERSRVTGLLTQGDSPALTALHFMALHDADEQLQGVMVAQLNMAVLSATIARAAQLESESIALVDLDLQLVTRHPPPTAEGVGIGLPFELAPLSRAVREGLALDGMIVRSPMDQQVRLLSGKRLESAPYLVVIGRSTTDILRPWWRELRILMGGWLVTALLGWLALRRHLSALASRQRLAREVVQRKQAQSDIQQREAELRTLVTGIEALLLRFDEHGNLQFAHAHRPDLLLAPPEQLIGRHYSEILPGDIAERFRVALDRVANTGLPVEVGYRLSLDGVPRDFKAVLRPLLNDAAIASGTVVLATDITREKALEAQLRIAAMAFDTHLGMFITDADGNVIKTNGTFTQITGYSESEVVGRNPRMWSSGQHDADFYRDMWGAIERDGSWQGEVWNRRKTGEIYPQWLTISAIRNAHDELLHFVATLSDLSASKEAEDAIHRLAFYDPLTGLPNRQRLQDRLHHLAENPERQQEHAALLLVGLDNFKAYNSTLGHQQGDALLQQVAERIGGSLDENEALARWGGDQFVLLSRHLGSDPQSAALKAQRAADALLLQIRACSGSNQKALPISASIGIALFHQSTQESAQSVHQAELAMYEAKRQGGNTSRFFDTSMQAAMVERTRLEADLYHALERGELVLHYQAQVNEAGDPIGVECLLRWQHAERGMISPGVFIPLAEESSLIVPIGHWVLETACRQLAEWRHRPELQTLTLSVNVSPAQFNQPGFFDEVCQLLNESGADPTRLMLEVTEGLFLHDPRATRLVMERLNSLGVQFSLDDFGTGYSSLGYLKGLPLDELKIDQSFVRDLLESPADAAIVMTIIALAEKLNLSVIAEGVETVEQRDWLMAHGCQRFQGYLFARPQPIESALITERHA